jgi:hypothetical protein
MVTRRHTKLLGEFALLGVPSRHCRRHHAELRRCKRRLSAALVGTLLGCIYAINSRKYGMVAMFHGLSLLSCIILIKVSFVTLL